MGYMCCFVDKDRIPVQLEEIKNKFGNTKMRHTHLTMIRQ